MDSFRDAACSINSKTCCFTLFGKLLNAFLTRLTRRLCGMQTMTKSPAIPRRIARIPLPRIEFIDVAMLPMKTKTTAEKQPFLAIRLSIESQIVLLRMFHTDPSIHRSQRSLAIRWGSTSFSKGDFFPLLNDSAL